MNLQQHESRIAALEEKVFGKDKAAQSQAVDDARKAEEAADAPKGAKDQQTD